MSIHYTENGQQVRISYISRECGGQAFVQDNQANCKTKHGGGKFSKVLCCAATNLQGYFT